VGTGSRVRAGPSTPGRPARLTGLESRPFSSDPWSPSPAGGQGQQSPRQDDARNASPVQHCHPREHLQPSLDEAGGPGKQARPCVDYQEVLRRFAIGDTGFLDHLSPGHEYDLDAFGLDTRARCFARLGASVALGASSSGYQPDVNAALATGATVSEIVGVLIAVGSTVGLAKVVAAAPALGLAVGYDPETALEAPGQNEG